MRIPTVCSSPTGNLWLLVEEHAAPDRTRWVNLETGEDRWMQRSLARLLSFGWRLVEGDLEWRAT